MVVVLHRKRWRDRDQAREVVADDHYLTQGSGAFLESKRDKVHPTPSGKPNQNPKCHT